MLTTKLKLTNPLKLDAPSEFLRSLWVCYGNLPGNEENVIGVDPGVNFGVTLVQGENVGVYYGSLARRNKPGEYARLAYDLLSYLSHQTQRFHSYKSCIIEGAAYHKTFGQVGLAEVRIGFYLRASLDSALFPTDPQIVPPATIRKKVFGNSTQQAGEIFPTLNHNAADSIAIALYGLL